MNSISGKFANVVGMGTVFTVQSPSIWLKLSEKIRKAPLKKYQEAWKDQLRAAGFEPVIYEDFSDSFWSFWGKGRFHLCKSARSLEIDEYTSNMAIMLLRLPFCPYSFQSGRLFGVHWTRPQDANIEKWCERCVDAVGVDADQVQLIALAKTFGDSSVGPIWEAAWKSMIYKWMNLISRWRSKWRPYIMFTLSSRALRSSL